MCLQLFLAKLTWISTRHEILGHVHATTAHWINPWNHKDSSLGRLLTASSYLGARRLLLYARVKRTNRCIMNGGATKSTSLPPFPLVLSLLAQNIENMDNKIVCMDAPADQRHLVRVAMSLGVRVKGGCVKPRKLVSISSYHLSLDRTHWKHFKQTKGGIEKALALNLCCCCVLRVCFGKNMAW